MSPTCEVDVDTSKGDAALEQLEQHSRMTERLVVSTLRRSVASLNIIGDMMGMAVPMWFNMMYGASMMMYSTFKSIASALAASAPVSPWFAVQASFAFMSATLMFAQSFAIMSGERQANLQMQQIISLLNTWAI